MMCETRLRVSARQHLAVWLALLLSLCAQAHAQGWPSITIPGGVTTFDMGEQMTSNGLPTQVRGLLSKATPAQLASRFRASLGQPIAEDTLASKLILGKALGEYYVTVQIEPAGAGARGLIAVSKLSAALAQLPETHQAEANFKSKFLPGSKLLSRIDTIDGGKRASLLVFSNGHAPDLNIAHLKKVLRGDGFALERADTTAAPAAGPLHGTTLFFKGRDEEAVAVVYRAMDGTAIVLNTVRYPEHAK